MSISAGPLGDGPMNSSQGPTAVAHSWPYLIQQGVKLKFALVRVQITGPITGTGPKIRGRRNGTAYVGEAALELEGGDVYMTTTVIEAIAAFEADKTAFHGANVENPPWNIDWQVARDGTTWEDAGISSNPIYVCLENPKKGTGLPLNALEMFRTVVHLACSVGGATDADSAVANTWSLFAPKQVKTWDERDLFYYAFGTPASANAGTLEELLRMGTGKCIPWAHMLQDAWSINGVAANVDSNEASYYTIATCTLGVPSYFWVKTWADLPSSDDWFFFQSPAFDMRPPPPDGTYGHYNDGTGGLFKNQLTVEGQNSGDGAPSQKVFDSHQFVRYKDSDGFKKYYDPSYGLIYDDAADFQATSIAGYGNSTVLVGTKLRLAFKLPDGPIIDFDDP